MVTNCFYINIRQICSVETVLPNNSSKMPDELDDTYDLVLRMSNDDKIYLNFRTEEGAQKWLSSNVFAEDRQGFVAVDLRNDS